MSDFEEIKEKLRASRPSGADDQDPEFAELLEQTKTNPELKQWLEEERVHDRMIAAKLASIIPPQGLKEKILAQPKIVPFPFRKEVLWAAAAVLVTALVSISLLQQPVTSPEPLAFENYRNETVTFASSFWLLPHRSREIVKIREWLASSQSPPPSALPPKLEGLLPIGCRTLRMQGKNVSLICFRLQDGKTEAHLFVINRSDLQNTPPENAPAWASQKGWTTASWSDPSKVYILASAAAPGELQKFF